ncbi:hypothetical protein G6F68_012938 [Rhizopus microsporus]|nr:hypothetical protein G6F68_012938 [Rhizopus microsporus]
MPGAGGEGQHHGLVRFGNRVRDGRDAHGRAGGTCADHQRRTDCGVVGTAGSGAAQGEGNRQRHRVGPIKGDGVDQRHTAILVDGCRRDADRGHREVVVDDGAGGTGRCTHRVTGARGHGEDHRFIGFDLSIGDGNDVERGTGDVGRDGHAGHRTGVVGAAGRRPGKRQVHQHRGRLAGAARYRVHQRRATVLGDAARRYIDADGGRVADREGERLQFVVGRRACTVVGDPQGQWIGLRRATGRTAEGVHAVERDAWRQGARFHRIGVRRNAATAIQGQRERIADH